MFRLTVVSLNTSSPDDHLKPNFFSRPQKILVVEDVDYFLSQSRLPEVARLVRPSIENRLPWQQRRRATFICHCGGGFIVPTRRWSFAGGASPLSLLQLVVNDRMPLSQRGSLRTENPSIVNLDSTFSL